MGIIEEKNRSLENQSEIRDDENNDSSNTLTTFSTEKEHTEDDSETNSNSVSDNKKNKGLIHRLIHGFKEKHKQKQEKKRLKHDEKRRNKEEKRRIKEEERRIKDEEKRIKDEEKRLKESLGWKLIPLEDDEKDNTRLRVYNSLARAAYNLDTTPINFSPLTIEEVNSVYFCMCHDFPEIFWLNGYSYTSTTIQLKFRCLKSDGKVDKKQIDRKREELRKAAAPFVKGIKKDTDPYQAFLTIYRRLILTIDYDGIGLDNNNVTEYTDDTLRSLHSALVNHKVVCAGYAVALQYLLNLVGIPSCYVVSEDNANGGCHAFNIVKIGKHCYYVDATWGDRSNTKTGNANKNDISYEYCCVPYSEFIIHHDRNYIPYHIPRNEYYPNLKKYESSDYEYYRYHKAYFTRNDQKQLVDVICNFAINYNQSEMGNFNVSFRCASNELATTMQNSILRSQNLTNEVEKRLKELKQINKFYLVKKINSVDIGSSNRVVTINYDVKADNKKTEK